LSFCAGFVLVEGDVLLRGCAGELVLGGVLGVLGLELVADPPPAWNCSTRLMSLSTWSCPERLAAESCSDCAAVVWA
jgi:hypothetical protein